MNLVISEARYILIRSVISTFSNMKRGVAGKPNRSSLRVCVNISLVKAQVAVKAVAIQPTPSAPAASFAL